MVRPFNRRRGRSFIGFVDLAGTISVALVHVVICLGLRARDVNNFVRVRGGTAPSGAYGTKAIN